MSGLELPDDLQEAVRFHGHLCPGLVIGYRAAKIARQRLGAARAVDEELIAIVENDSCSVDGVQWMTGCTFGKGNLIFRDYGKQVFTFALRPSGRAVRVSLRARDEQHPPSEGNGDAAIRWLLEAPDEALFDIQEICIVPPGLARVRDSAGCELCGEPVMVSRTRRVGGRVLCIPCAKG